MLKPADAGGEPRYDSACFIVARNLGDAVIHSLFFRELVARGFARRYVVWTRPQVAFLYEGLPGCEVVGSQFPVGTSKQFDRHTAVGFLRAAASLRRMHLDVTIDLIGDFRERLFGRLAGSKQHLQIGWAPGHPFSRQIRNPFGVGHPSWIVPADHGNVYRANEEFLDALTGVVTTHTGAATAQPAVMRSVARGALRAARIGVHPFASQDCKKWPADSWTTLVAQLLDAGNEVVAFGAPSDRAALGDLFGAFGARVRVVTGSIPEFARELASLDILVGLDSFSVHMAENVGIASVMLNGANDPVLYAPPHATVMSSSGGCPVWPCQNKPSCVGSAGEYVCIRSISVDQVRDAVLQRLGSLQP